MFEKEYLNLTESHELNVTVYDEEQIFAGNLILSPQKCILRVMGEREPSKNFFNSKKLRCRSHNFYFGLFELESSLISSQLLQIKEGKPTIYFEHEFIIGFITYSKAHTNFNIKIKNIKIDAPFLKKWIGYTTTQIQVLESMKNNCKIINSTEFRTTLENYGEISLNYQMTSSWDSFSCEEKTHPNLNVHFDNPINIDMVYHEIKKNYNIMAFFAGYDFDISQIK